MTPTLPLCLGILSLATTLVAVESAPTTPPVVSGTKSAPPAVSLNAAEDTASLLARLPDPAALAQLNDYFARASSEDAGKVLMKISISKNRAARPAVIPMLLHRDPLVVDRALRAMTSIALGSTETRELVERILADGQPQVASLAATCLGSSEDMRAAPALIARLSKDPAEVSAAALGALKRLTPVDFKSDATAWQAWYQGYRSEADQRLAEQANLLGDPDSQKQISAIQSLSNMRSDRQEVLDLIKPMTQAENPTVVMAARQALATLAPSEYTMPSKIEVVAVVKPGGAAAPAKADRGMINYLADQGLFDTWYGMVLTALTGILVLSGVLFLLRSTPVKNITRRIGKVAMAGTARIMRPITNRIRKGTDRIVKSLLQKKASGEVKKPNGPG